MYSKELEGTDIESLWCGCVVATWEIAASLPVGCDVTVIRFGDIAGM